MQSSFLSSLGFKQPPPEKCVLPPKPPPAQRSKMSKAQIERALRHLLHTKFRPFLSVTPQLVQEIMIEPQHFGDGKTNMKWIFHRSHLATGSRLAGMIGWSPYETVTSTLENMLWRKFKGNVMTQFGTHNEPNAEKTTIDYFKSLNGQPNPKNPDEIQLTALVREVGLVRSRAFPFAGMSPDGILIRTFRNTKTNKIRTQRQLLEFKCPYKHRNLTNHWPAYNLYKAEHIPNVPGVSPTSTKIPVPQYYYTQLMWGALLMGLHNTQDILQSTGMEKVREFMETGAELEEVCGENLIDVEHPILFIVWTNVNELKHTVKMPDCYHSVPEQHTSFVRTDNGAIQITEVDYNREFTMWMLSAIFEFWRYQYLPRAIMKQKKVLLHGELDVPLDLEDDEEEEE